MSKERGVGRLRVVREEDFRVSKNVGSTQMGVGVRGVRELICKARLRQNPQRGSAMKVGYDIAREDT